MRKFEFCSRYCMFTIDSKLNLGINILDLGEMSTKLDEMKVVSLLGSRLMGRRQVTFQADRDVYIIESAHVWRSGAGGGGVLP